MRYTLFDHLEDLPHRRLHFAANEMVVDMGASIGTLFVVKSGMVHLLRFQEDGGTVVLQRAGAGALMAEASVFSQSYHCAAVAVKESVLAAYPIKAVREMLTNKPEAVLAFARLLASEVREARKRAEILALKRVSERLEAWLTWNDGNLPERGMLHHVADEIGVSREALYRELSKRWNGNANSAPKHSFSTPV
jgi:CRP/FNR family transcriptional regulator, dissimilatory nitrate respiration regulator